MTNFSDYSTEVQLGILKSLQIDEDLKEIVVQQNESLPSGSNFLGCVSKLNIAGHSLFFKTETKDDQIRELFNSKKMFFNEYAFYHRVIPRLAAITATPVVFPKAIYLDQNLIVMKDLAEDGYNCAPREFCNLYLAKFILRALGAFHASSLVMRILEPNDYAVFGCFLEETIYSQDRTKLMTQFRILFNKVFEKIQPKFCNRPEILRKLQTILTLQQEKINKLVDPEESEPYTVVCHGDIWLNNILLRFKQNTNDQIPESIAFLDFQLSRMASPVTDLMYFLYICTNSTIRKAHYNELIETYYTGFRDQVTEANLDCEDVFPRTAFQDHLKRFSLFGLFASIVMLPVFLNTPPPMDIEEYNKTADHPWQFSDSCIQCITDIIEEFDQLNYLQYSIM